MIHLDELIALAIVAIAAGVVAWRGWCALRAGKRRSSSGCGRCKGSCD